MLPAVTSPHPPELDAFTLARAARGERAACVALVARYERPVFALIGRMMRRRDPQRVEDLAQETFLRVFRGLPRFDPDGSARLSSWILTIATRLCIDALRRGEIEIPAEEVPEVAVMSEVEGQLDRARLGADLAEAAARLPEIQRAVFVLRTYHDLSDGEIAEALTLAPGTVKSRLSRARAALKRALQARGWEIS